MKPQKPADAFRHRGFGYWIMGYQGFVEPIIRSALSMKLLEEGFTPSRERIIRKPDLEAVIDLLQNSQSLLSISDGEKSSFMEFLRQRTRLQLDVAFETSEGVIIGEIKSWGGWNIFNEKIAREMFFSGRDALLFLSREIGGKPVDRVLIVVWGQRSNEHDAILKCLETRYECKVQIEYADDLLAEHPPHSEIDRQIEMLEETSEDIKRWLRAFGKSSS